MSNNQKILLIDDDFAMADMIGLLVTGMQRGPLVLEHAADYATGLERLLSGDFVVCLLDYHLGLRDGLELLREAKARRCVTPVIVLTGAGNEDVDIAAMDRGAADYLEKGQVTLHGLERAVYYAMETADAMARLQQAKSG